MSVGKYSPTVSAAYARDQEWHRKLQTDASWADDEGYDSYGYHTETGLDRAGYDEFEYLSDGQWVDDKHYRYHLYEDVGSEWGFDGVRPVKM